MLDTSAVSKTTVSVCMQVQAHLKVQDSQAAAVNPNPAVATSQDMHCTWHDVMLGLKAELYIVLASKTCKCSFMCYKAWSGCTVCGSYLWRLHFELALRGPG